MGRGSEGHAGGGEGRQGQPRAHETHCERLAEEHDEAARAVKQRRAGSRFRYRRRRPTVPLSATRPGRTFPCIIPRGPLDYACASGVMASIGTIAFGTDPGSDWTSVRTAVETRFIQTRFTPMTSICYFRTQLHSSSANDFTTVTPGSRRAHATFGYSRLWPASARASLQPQLQRTCICSRLPASSPLAMRPSLPTACQLQPASPITGFRPITRPACTNSSSPPASMRPAAPPACRSNCPGRLAWTRPSLGRTAQRLHTPCHSVSHSTLRTLEKSRKENYEKKIPTRILGCNNFFQEPGEGTCAQWHQLWTRADPVYASLVLRTPTPHDHRLLRADIHHGTSLVQQQIAPLARAGCRTAIRYAHA